MAKKRTKKERRELWENVRNELEQENISIVDIAKKYKISRQAIYVKGWDKGWIVQNLKEKPKEKPRKMPKEEKQDFTTKLKKAFSVFR